MKSIGVEFRNAYNIDILPELDDASMIKTISILRVVFLNNIRPEISLIMQQI